MSDFVCEVCKKGPEEEGIAIIRTSKKGPGEDPHWRCRDHVDTPVDKAVDEVVKLIEDGK